MGKESYFEKAKCVSPYSTGKLGQWYYLKFIVLNIKGAFRCSILVKVNIIVHEKVSIEVSLTKTANTYDPGDRGKEERNG